jgi:hypothetical protein
VDGLAAAIDELRTLDARAVARGELTGMLRALSRQMNRLEALRCAWVP